MRTLHGGGLLLPCRASSQLHIRMVAAAPGIHRFRSHSSSRHTQPPVKHTQSCARHHQTMDRCRNPHEAHSGAACRTSIRIHQRHGVRDSVTPGHATVIHPACRVELGSQHADPWPHVTAPSERGSRERPAAQAGWPMSSNRSSDGAASPAKSLCLRDVPSAEPLCRPGEHLHGRASWRDCASHSHGTAVSRLY